MGRFLSNPTRRLWLVVTTLVAALFLMVAVAPVAAQSETIPDGENTQLADIYDEVSPSVVSISVVSRQGGNGSMGPDEAVGGGTGFVFDTEGHIITNNHVVENATEIIVSFVDGTLARASVIGLDPDSDLAVLELELPQEDLDALQPVTFGDSSALRIGEPVIAIGSPFGQRWTLTSGIISALDRSIRGLTNFSIGGVIQTDAAINPGNSGGPLLNMSGEVVGVNSQIISRSGSNAGIGFAIPGNLAQVVARQLIETGFVSYSYLGISGTDVSLSVIEQFDLPNNTQGVVVAEVSPGGPASRAGLESGQFTENTEGTLGPVPQSVDIITAIDGEPLTGIGDLIGYLAANTQPGDSVTLDVLRLGPEMSEDVAVDVRLTPRP